MVKIILKCQRNFSILVQNLKIKISSNSRSLKLRFYKTTFPLLQPLLMEQHFVTIHFQPFSFNFTQIISFQIIVNHLKPISAVEISLTRNGRSCQRNSQMKIGVLLSSAIIHARPSTSRRVDQPINVHFEFQHVVNFHHYIFITYI